ncbi:MAG: acylneuraminate cytidylyltransferase family protein [Candidatus Omnitrophica bacterium]|nr:acylneuraminate cytidylyltransferase family protein [Candidatus Omnitrophota bacterium]
MNDEVKLSALVPMKGNSQRIPHKNIRFLGGKPLCFYILESLEKCDLIKEIVVNTDSNKIIELLRNKFQKIVVHKRPNFLLGDKVPMTPIIEYDLKHIKSDYFIQTHATNPFLKTETITNAIREFFQGLSDGYDSAIGVTAYRTRFYNKDKNSINHNPDVMVPSQDMIPIYEDNSNFYINSLENFNKMKNRVGVNPKFIEVPKLESIDIDEKEDFLLAEAFMDYIRKNNL